MNRFRASLLGPIRDGLESLRENFRQAGTDTSSTPGDDVQAFLVCLVTGLVLVLVGFYRLAKRRRLENTPISHVASAAVGPVRLRGKARARERLASPVRGVPCCWWRCTVKELNLYNTLTGRTFEHNGLFWHQIKRHSKTGAFYLEESRSVVLIDPSGSSVESVSETFDLTAATAALLLPYLDRWGIASTSASGKLRKLRLVEEYIPNDAVLFVNGELKTKQYGVDNDTHSLARPGLEGMAHDPAAMAKADLNRDGIIDDTEWDVLRVEQNDGGSTPKPTGVLTVVKAEDISTRAGTRSVLGCAAWIVGGLALSSWAAWRLIVLILSLPIGAVADMGTSVVKGAFWLALVLVAIYIVSVRTIRKPQTPPSSLPPPMDMKQ